MLKSFDNLLIEVTNELASYLGGLLPSFDADWWSTRVVPELSFQQQRIVKQHNVRSLSGLDLAALLRVLDQNWYDISDKDNLPYEGRNYVKEMQTVRNKYAHLKPEGLSNDDIYRDLDTLQRFAGIIKANQQFIEEVKQSKQRVITQSGNLVKLESGDNSEMTNEQPKFKIGQIVAPKSDLSKSGAITEVKPGEPEYRYSVFQDGSVASYYESQLQAKEEDTAKFEFVPFSQFQAYLTSLQINQPTLRSLYSLNAARIDYIPYQFRPVLKFINSDRPRMLIADSVGVGKTIEAGLILRELQARMDVRSVLIICPKPLITERKWQSEMRRFDEKFTHLDGKTLRYCINETDLDGHWPELHAKTIIPYSLLDESLLFGRQRGGNQGGKQLGLLELDPPPRFDLVIVDEAHHIRNTNTFSHRGVRFFCDNAEAVLFLTATPIMLGKENLFVLLNVLRPDLIIDQESFEHMSEPNPYINRAIDLLRTQISGSQDDAQAALENAALTPWGQSMLQDNPDFQRVYDLLGEKDMSPETRISCITDIEQMHTFSGIINRTRRRDIGDFTIRKPETVTVEFTPEQRELHDNLLRVQASILTLLHGNQNVLFMMSTIRRQAASCLFGLAPLLRDILSRRLDELINVEADDSYSSLDYSFVNNIENEIQGVIDLAERLKPEDPKLDALRKIVRDKQELQNNKIMLFSTYRHTLSYLFEHLSQDGFRVGLVHGGVPDEDRVVLRNRFQMPRDEEKAIDLLLFSEVGCEGLDYQFCDCIVNYDLPWNPMKIEQRIGRIDRNGQRSETVAIYNLITPGTVDADIYERCLQRIGIFEKALGGGEEILGEISREIRNIADNFALSSDDRKVKLQQLTDNKIRLIKEQQDLEEKQVELFGIRLPEVQTQQEIDAASSYWLSQEALKNLISHYLSLRCGCEQEYILGEKALKTLRLSQEARGYLLIDFQKLPRQSSVINREWERWLKGDDPHMQITFDSTSASQNPNATFLMPIHPLVRQAAVHFNQDKDLFVAIKIFSDSIQPGDYPFIVYQWHYIGVREDYILKVVSSNDEIILKHNSIFENGIEFNLLPAEIPSREVYDSLDSIHYKLWIEAKSEHLGRTNQVASYKRESLSKSHSARIALLQEQLDQAIDEKIQRMRRSQIGSAEADFERRLGELDQARERADILFKPVGCGLIRAVKEGTDAK